MARTTSISLGPHFEDFVARQVAEGRFGTASEVIRAGLRLLENDEARLAALRSALDEGDAGGYVAWSLDDVRASIRRRKR